VDVEQVRRLAQRHRVHAPLVPLTDVVDEYLDAPEAGHRGASRVMAGDVEGARARVLLYLFGSKDELLRQLLARARHEQVTLMAAALTGPSAGDFEALVDRLWTFLSAPEQHPMVRLTYEAFMLALSHDPGPWAGFAGEAAREWLDLLVRAQPGTPPDLAEARATRALALVRGLLLDLLACEEPEQVAAAMRE
jgi:AcrR family transcriptional regulator